MALPDINLSSILVILSGVGGIIGGLVAFLKYRREADSVIAEASRESVESQDIVLKNLRKEITRLVNVIEQRDAKIEQLSNQLAAEIQKAKDEVIAAIH